MSKINLTDSEFLKREAVAACPTTCYPTLEAIKQAAGTLGLEVSIEGGKVHWYDTFATFEDDEPHDIAWDRLCCVSEDLEEKGLRVVDSWSDNDSLGGVIVPTEEVG